MDAVLKSENIAVERKTFIFDLRENPRGRFLPGANQNPHRPEAQRPPERTPSVPPLKALHALCRTDAGMRIVPPPKVTSMRGVNLASTPSSPSFRDWYKYGSRTRDIFLGKEALYH